MRPALAAAVLAVALGLAYALWLQPGFEPTASDQVSYLNLARGLVTRGEYTRAPVGDPFAAEPLRPPGYPLFLAPLCIGGCDHWRVAIVQALLFGALVLLAYEIASATLSRRRAIVATFLVAGFLPIAYYSALALSDFLAVFLIVAGLAAFLRARRTASVPWAAAAGALLGWLALTRAVYVFFPAMLALVVLIAEGRNSLTRRVLVPFAAFVVAFALVVAPLFAYSSQHFGRLFASSSGSAVWLGAMQGITEENIDAFTRGELEAVRTEVRRFDAITDRVAQADAWIAFNAVLADHGTRVIAHDPLGYLARTPLRAVILWAGDLPVPTDMVPAMPVAVRAGLGAVQLVLCLLGLIGAIALARHRTDGALLPLAVILYVSAVGVPLGTEARYALAAKPLLLIAAVAGVSALRRRRGAGAST
jgi:4-amino-4-deoxy-L-arabinose transferase-like glycosyltransferase